MKVVFIAYDGIVSQSVFESQILGQLEPLRTKKGAECVLVAFESAPVYFRRLPEIKALKGAIEKKSGIRCLFLPRTPGFAGLRLSAALLPRVAALRGVLARGEKAIIHGRGSKGCFIALELRRRFPGCRVVFDSRSSEPEQYVSDHFPDGRVDPARLPGKLKRLFETLTFFERRSVEEADHIFSQCGELKRSLMEKYGAPDEKFSVFPNAVSLDVFRFDGAQRDEAREELGVADRFVVVYCGTVHPYQLPDRSVEFFKRLLWHEPRSFFLGLTFSPEKVEGLLDRAGVDRKDYRVMKLAYRDVPRYMSAGDAGLLFRVQNEYSRTSAPVKLAEYLSTGLFVVTLSGIGDASEFVSSSSAGMVLDDAGDESLERGAALLAARASGIMGMEEKLRITALARGQYSQETQVEEKYRCYRRLLGR